MSLIALTRAVSPAMARCELTHQPRVPIDADRAAAQHAGYERSLAELGCSVRRLPSSPDMPDSVFIEDAAVVLDEIAIVTRPGAASRRAETRLVADTLGGYRPLGTIEAPGTMDGGDVLLVGRSIFVGRSSRTNDEGLEQLRRLAAPFGYEVAGVTVRGCLHLKSAVTAVSDQAVLVNREWIEPDGLAAFRSLELIDVDPVEPLAANVVRVGKSLLSAAAYPRTRERLEKRGFGIAAVDVGEIAKAEGAVTCCSLIFKVLPR